MLFWKPAKRIYTINIFEEVKNRALAQDFNSGLDNNYWTITNTGEVFNEELQYYNPKNININNGFLELEAKKEDFEGHKYTSGSINTKGKFEFQYGKIILRAKPAYGKGLLSAIWLLPADNSLYPEIDILEALGSNNEAWTGVHYVDSNLKHQKNFVTIPIKDEFSIYEVNWEENEISVLVDNKLIYKTNVGVPDKKMYLIINLSVGGTWLGNPDDATLPSKFLLDYVVVIPKVVDEK